MIDGITEDDIFYYVEDLIMTIGKYRDHFGDNINYEIKSCKIHRIRKQNSDYIVECSIEKYNPLITPVITSWFTCNIPLKVNNIKIKRAIKLASILHNRN